jgi:hypothetical protein
LATLLSYWHYGADAALRVAGFFLLDIPQLFKDLGGVTSIEQKLLKLDIKACNKCVD